MSIFVGTLTGGTNNHQTTSEEANALATDLFEEGITGSIGNTSGVAPSTGGFAANAQNTPDMTIMITPGVAYVSGTPASQDSQLLRVRMTDNENVSISANTTGVTKYDWVYISLDTNKMANPSVNADDVATFVTSRSTSSSSDNGTPPTYGYCIAVITVANNATSITNGNIADKRSQVSLPDKFVKASNVDFATFVTSSTTLDTNTNLGTSYATMMTLDVTNFPTGAIIQVIAIANERQASSTNTDGFANILYNGTQYTEGISTQSFSRSIPLLAFITKVSGINSVYIQMRAGGTYSPVIIAQAGSAAYAIRVG